MDHTPRCTYCLLLSIFQRLVSVMLSWSCSPLLTVLSICSNFSINSPNCTGGDFDSVTSPAESRAVLSVDPLLYHPLSRASTVMAKTVPKVLLLPVPADISSLSFGLIPIILANLSVKRVFFVCESSFIFSGVFPVTSFPLPIGEISIVFAF